MSRRVWPSSNIGPTITPIVKRSQNLGRRASDGGSGRAVVDTDWNEPIHEMALCECFSWVT
jgi:hypothetical protein